MSIHSEFLVACVIDGASIQNDAFARWTCVGDRQWNTTRWRIFTAIGFLNIEAIAFAICVSPPTTHPLLGTHKPCAARRKAIRAHSSMLARVNYVVVAPHI